MPDALFVGGSLAAGLLFSGGLMTAAQERRPLEMASGISRLWPALIRWLRDARPGRWLSAGIERAGWRETPERIAVMALALALCLGVAGWLIAPAVSPMGFIAGCVLVEVTLNSAIQ